MAYSYIKNANSKSVNVAQEFFSLKTVKLGCGRKVNIGYNWYIISVPSARQRVDCLNCRQWKETSPAARKQKKEQFKTRKTKQTVASILKAIKM